MDTFIDKCFNSLSSNFPEKFLDGLQKSTITDKDIHVAEENLGYRFPTIFKDFLKSYPSALSGGMRQRAALIRTLAVDPDVLLLDEPFSALDYQTRLSVCDDVYKIIRSEHKTAVLITHDISEAVSVADKIVVLSRRPARVVSRHTLSFPENEPLKRRENKEFSTWFELLWRELNA